jgi:hypothetical protein
MLRSLTQGLKYSWLTEGETGVGCDRYVREGSGILMIYMTL